jgi:hypothetical protein
MPTHFAYATLQEAISLLQKGYSCWIADINWVLCRLLGTDSAHNVFIVKNIGGDTPRIPPVSTPQSLLPVRSCFYRLAGVRERTQFKRLPVLRQFLLISRGQGGDAAVKSKRSRFFFYKFFVD